MTKLRTKMIEGMQLHGLSERTQDAYVRLIRQLAGVIKGTDQTLRLWEFERRV